MIYIAFLSIIAGSFYNEYYRLTHASHIKIENDCLLTNHSLSLQRRYYNPMNLSIILKHEIILYLFLLLFVLQCTKQVR